MAVSGCAVMTDACHQGCFTPANHYFLSLPPPPAERRRRRVNILIAPKHAIALRSTRRLVNGPALGSAPRSRREPPLRAPVSQWAPATHPSCAARYNEHSSRRADVSVGRPIRPPVKLLPPPGPDSAGGRPGAQLDNRTAKLCYGVS